jgi:hypothetical protein
MITFPQIGYMGRLGNQMFQFASTLGIANRLGFEARFPIENCLNFIGSGPFDPKIGRPMDVKCDLLDCFDISSEYFIPQRHMGQEHSYHENKFGYNQEIESLSDNYSLNGYFQTEKYFNEFRDLILSQFVFKSSYRDQAESYIQTIRDKNKGAVLASIHVRRGDYVMFPDHHPPCSFNYYNNAMEELRILNNNITYVIFSDDVEWCREEFNDPAYVISDLENPYTEMCAMALCEHNIIANSSFSWWGAWLNTNLEKTVIAPARWFGPAMGKDVSDVYCKDWIIL